MSTNISYDYPKAPTNKSAWEIGKIYKYKTHPMPCTCHWSEQWVGLKTMICDECGYNTTNNWCPCSPKGYMLHKDRQMNRSALKNPDTPDNIKKFKEAKSCTPEEFRSHVKQNEHDYRKGITDIDHYISPNDKRCQPEFMFDLTNKQHEDFIRHYKNFRMLPTSVNQQKGSSNNLDELKIIFEEFAKQTPAGDIHDILIAMRKRGHVTEVPHITKEVAVKKEVEEETDDEEPEDEEPEDEEEVDEEDAELVREEAEIAKAKADFAIQMDKREAELKAKKARKEIKNKLPELREALIAKEQALFDKQVEAFNKKIADIKSGLFDEQLISNEL